MSEALSSTTCVCVCVWLVLLREAVLTRHRYLANNGQWFLRSSKAGWNDVQDVFSLLIASCAYDCALGEGMSGYDLSHNFMWDAIVVCINVVSSQEK